MNALEKIAITCGREIKNEHENILQILLTMFSAFTNHPQNSRILAPSGEGKTYLVTKLAELFPQENVHIIAKATPQSFKYTLSSKRVVENGAGSWQEYDIAINPLLESLEEAKTKDEKQEIESQIKQLQDSACDLVDFTNKLIILVDSQSFDLFESLKTTLSHDQEFMKSFSVNKTKSGTIKGQKFLIKGFPAVIYCSAKDEQQRDETNEINTRFHTLTLNLSGEKYRQMLELEGLRASLPNAMYQEEVISDDEIESLREEILEIIEEIKTNSEILNPYGIGLSKLFSNDAGFRTRQLKILNSNIQMYTLVSASNRPKIVYEGQTTPVSTWNDVLNSVRLTKSPQEIQSYKIKQFNDFIRPFILESGKSKEINGQSITCLTANGIAELFCINGKPTDRKRLQETILQPLAQHGYLEKFVDPYNMTRHVYAVASQYAEETAPTESTLVDISTLDKSCVESFIEQQIKRRFDSGKLHILDKNGNEINPEQLVYILNEIDTDTDENTNKFDNVDSSTNVEGDM